jgi:hypothetical protein
MNPLIRNCREVTRLVLEGEDRALTVGERTVLRLHWAVCEGCSRFRDQVGVMRGALAARRRADEGGEGGPPA